MSNFLTAVTTAVQGAACLILNSPGTQAAEFVSGLVPTSGYDDAIRGLRRLVCDDTDDNVNQPPPEFTGGQCVGAPYTAGWTYLDGSPFIYVASVVGPISSMTASFSRPGPFPNVEYWNYRIVHAGGVSEGEEAVQPKDDAPGLIQIFRQDGQPDNCGDPPPPRPDTYVPSPTTVNITYVDNTMNTFNEDVDITIFAPFIGIGGAIFAPITIAGNTFQLAGTLQFSPDFKLEVNPVVEIGPRGSADGEPPPPDYPTELPESTQGRRVIVGAIVTATTVTLGKKTEIDQEVNPDIFAPRIGNLSFLISTDKGVAWTEDIPIKNVRQFVTCPFYLGAVDVAATAEEGFELDVVPVFDYPPT